MYPKGVEGGGGGQSLGGNVPQKVDFLINSLPYRHKYERPEWKDSTNLYISSAFDDSVNMLSLRDIISNKDGRHPD